MRLPPDFKSPDDLALTFVANELDLLELTDEQLHRTLVDLLARDAEIRYLVAQRLGNTDGCTSIEISPAAPAA